MKNGPYELLIAPENYPGKKYRDKYCYEHTLVYWQNYCIIPPKGYEIHHINMEHRDNRIENLQLITSEDHKKIHGIFRNKEAQIKQICGFCNKEFNLRRSNVKTRLKQNKFNKIFCSRKCGANHQYSRVADN